MTPDLVIFDCDGVLVDSERISNELIAADLSARGWVMDTDMSMRLFVGGTIAGVADQARAKGLDMPVNWVEDFYERLYQRLAKGTPEIPGVSGVLDRLEQASVPFCVASNGSVEKMQITLGQNGLLPRFGDAVFSAHTLGLAKPDPGLFLAAATHFQVAPNGCVVIEDSATGALAAKRANMRCAGYAPDDAGAGLADHGAQVFHDMKDLPGILGLGRN